MAYKDYEDLLLRELQPGPPAPAAERRALVAAPARFADPALLTAAHPRLAAKRTALLTALLARLAEPSVDGLSADVLGLRLQRHAWPFLFWPHLPGWYVAPAYKAEGYGAVAHEYDAVAHDGGAPAGVVRAALRRLARGDRRLLPTARGRDKGKGRGEKEEEDEDEGRRWHEGVLGYRHIVVPVIHTYAYGNAEPVGAGYTWGPDASAYERTPDGRRVLYLWSLLHYDGVRGAVFWHDAAAWGADGRRAQAAAFCDGFCFRGVAGAYPLRGHGGGDDGLRAVRHERALLRADGTPAPELAPQQARTWACALLTARRLMAEGEADEAMAPFGSGADVSNWTYWQVRGAVLRGVADALACAGHADVADVAGLFVAGWPDGAAVLQLMGRARETALRARAAAEAALEGLEVADTDWEDELEGTGKRVGPPERTPPVVEPTAARSPGRGRKRAAEETEHQAEQTAPASKKPRLEDSPREGRKAEPGAQEREEANKAVEKEPPIEQQGKTSNKKRKVAPTRSDDGWYRPGSEEEDEDDLASEMDEEPPAKRPRKAGNKKRQQRPKKAVDDEHKLVKGGAGGDGKEPAAKKETPKRAKGVAKKARLPLVVPPSDRVLRGKKRA